MVLPVRPRNGTVYLVPRGALTVRLETPVRLEMQVTQQQLPAGQAAPDSVRAQGQRERPEPDDFPLPQAVASRVESARQDVPVQVPAPVLRSKLRSRPTVEGPWKRSARTVVELLSP
jgi:hypothetical protein